MLRRTRLCLAVLAAVAGSGSVALSAASADTASIPALKHVWVIQLENKSFDEAFQNKSSTYLWSELPRQGVLLREEYGTGHLSLDNYISQLSGQAGNPETLGDCPDYRDVTPTVSVPAPVTGQTPGTGCVYPASTPTLVGQLTTANLTWHGWMGDMGNNPAREQASCGIPATAGVADNPAAVPPTADDTQSATASDQYAGRHNPFIYFHSITDDQVSCKKNVTPLTGLAASLSGPAGSTPNFNYITPNLCDDAHDATCVGPNLSGSSDPNVLKQGGLVAADYFLRKYVPMITSSAAFKDGGLLVVDFDEGDVATAPNTQDVGCCGVSSSAGGGLTGAIIISPFTTPGTISYVGYNHYSLLRSLEDGFGINSGGTDGAGHIGYAAQSLGTRQAASDSSPQTAPFVAYGCDIYSNFTGGCGVANPSLPEVALPIALPLIALAGGSVVVVRRRRRRATA